MKVNEVLQALTDCGVPTEVAEQAIDAIARNRLQQALDLCAFALPDSDVALQAVAKDVVHEAFRSRQSARQAESRRA